MYQYAVACNEKGFATLHIYLRYKFRLGLNYIVQVENLIMLFLTVELFQNKLQILSYYQSKVSLMAIPLMYLFFQLLFGCV